MRKPYIVLIYLRLSVEDITVKNGGCDESNSIENQRYLLRDYIRRKSDFNGCTIVELCDDGYSGTNLNRPGMKALMEKVKRKEADCIIVKDFSRFGRDYLMVSDYIDQIFPFLGIRFISVNDGYDSQNYQGITSGVEVAFRNMAYAYYSKDISAKVRSGFRAKAQRGDYLSAFAPFGYQKDKNNKNHLVVEERSAVIVKRIFHMAVIGIRPFKIAYLLNAEQIPTPSMFKNEQGLNHKWWEGLNPETLWNHNKITLILRDERYLGKTVYGKQFRPEVGNPKVLNNQKADWIIVPDCHEPLVTLEEFQSAQMVIREIERHDETLERHIFAEKISCGVCGYAMSKGSKKARVYRCKTKYRTSQYDCADNYISKQHLIDIVWEAILHYCRILLDRYTSIKKRNTFNKVSDLQTKIVAYQASLANLDEKKALLYEKLLDGEVDREVYIHKRDALSSQQEQIRQEVMLLEDKLQVMRDSPVQNVPEPSELQKFLLEEELTREMVNVFVKKIYVYSASSIHIEWLFEEEINHGQEQESVYLLPDRARESEGFINTGESYPCICC